MLNPLQYLPIIGTLYRAETGDQIPEAVRRIGSLIVSALIGGPIGVMTNIATTIAEKITGINIDTTAQAFLTGHEPASATTPAVASATTPAVASATTPAVASAQASPAASQPATAAPPSAVTEATNTAWTQRQLLAYGVTSDSNGTLSLGDTSGADVLNTLELVRLQNANAAYASSNDSARHLATG